MLVQVVRGIAIAWVDPVLPLLHLLYCYQKA